MNGRAPAGPSDAPLAFAHKGAATSTVSTTQGPGSPVTAPLRVGTPPTTRRRTTTTVRRSGGPLEVWAATDSPGPTDKSDARGRLPDGRRGRSAAAGPELRSVRHDRDAQGHQPGHRRFERRVLQATRRRRRASRFRLSVLRLDRCCRRRGDEGHRGHAGRPGGRVPHRRDGRRTRSRLLGLRPLRRVRQYRARWYVPATVRSSDGTSTHHCRADSAARARTRHREGLAPRNPHSERVRVIVTSCLGEPGAGSTSGLGRPAWFCLESFSTVACRR